MSGEPLVNEPIPNPLNTGPVNPDENLFVNNRQPPQNANVPNNLHVLHMPNYPGPVWNGNAEEFDTYVLHFKVYIEGIDSYLKQILEKGPFVPYIMTVLTEATDTTPATTKTTAKPFEQWSEEDRRLVQLDAKLRNMVLASVPKILVPTLVPHLTTKSMFDQLVDQNKGNAKSLKAQKVNLNKAYETFFA